VGLFLIEITDVIGKMTVLVGREIERKTFVVRIQKAFYLYANLFAGLANANDRTLLDVAAVLIGHRDRLPYCVCLHVDPLGALLMERILKVRITHGNTFLERFQSH
jgi:hypothetical protein